MPQKKKNDVVKIFDQRSDLKTTTDIFDRLGKKATILVLALLIGITGFVFKDYLFLEKYYIFKDIGSDTYNAFYPNTYAITHYIAVYGLPKWSFSNGMGQGIFPFFLHSPFDLLFYISGEKNIIASTIYVEVLKVILTGLTFYYYLRTMKLSNYTSIVGCLWFAFCGYCIVGSAWYVFSYEIFLLALLLLAFELLLLKQKWQLFPIVIFLIATSLTFNLYVYGLFLTTYAILRLYQTEDLISRKGAILFLKLAGLGVLGLLLSGTFLIENIVQYLESPRGSGANSYAHILQHTKLFSVSSKDELATAILRSFSSDIIGTGNDFKGWQNYLEAPLFYCGLPCILLVSQIFPSLEKKKKSFFIIFIVAWLLPFIFPYFRYLFWLFIGNYYRSYSLIIAFLLIYYSVYALEYIIQKRKINVPLLVISILTILFLLNVKFYTNEDAVNSNLQTFVTCMVLLYGILLFFMGTSKNGSYFKYLFVIAVAFELCFLSSISVNERDAESADNLAQKKGYNDYTVEAVEFLKHTDNTFYRVDKAYASSPAMHYSLNDAMVQKYNGTSSYSSFNQEYYISYLQLMGISDKTDELQSRWARGLGDRPILESENRVKYILAKKNINPLWRFTCDSLATFGDVKVLRNKYLLPIGYTYSNYIKESVFGNLSTAQRDFVSLRACVLRDEDVSKYPALKEFQLRDTLAANAFTFDIYRSYVNDLSKDTLTVDKFDDNRIAGKITLNEDKMMYLSVPYDGGWKLTVDGQPRNKIILSAGMTGIMLGKGAHTIEMVYDLRYFSKGLMLSLLGIVLYAGLWLFTRKKKVTTEPTATI